MNNNNLAILGGTFNPVHYGHLKIAELVSTTLGFDEIIFIPNNTPPHKEEVNTAASHRLAMLEIAINDYLLAHNDCKFTFTIDKTELNRTGASYMYDTLLELKSNLKSKPKYSNKNFWLILGLDSFYSLPEWHNWPGLQKLCNFIVINRNSADINIKFKPNWVTDYLKQNAIDPITSNKLLFDSAASKEVNGKVVLLDSKPIDISATQIRHLFKDSEKNKAKLLELVPEAVFSYIKHHNLY